MDEIKEKKISVMALGGAGCRILREIAKDPLAAPLNLIAVDTDRDSLAETGLPEEKQILAGVCWRDGAGCGGSPLDGQRAIAHERFELEKAIQGSHIALDIDRQIGDEGRNISSGEQRRVEIARSLLKAASVIIFDEVVSTLDIETAYDIEKSALELPDKTVIFISHNFSGKLIRKYDKILVLSAGKIVASGTYDELIENSPYFQRICNIKFG
jgi:ABC-type sugar transport system ATPase subunit